MDPRLPVVGIHFGQAEPLRTVVVNMRTFANFPDVGALLSRSDVWLGSLLRRAAADRGHKSFARFSAESVYDMCHVAGVDPHPLRLLTFAVSVSDWPTFGHEAAELPQRDEDRLFDS